MPRADGPFRVLQRIGENAYKIELPGDYGVSATFNVSNLSPYYKDQEHQVDFLFFYNKSLFLSLVIWRQKKIVHL
jgi:hypothetical protein